MTFQMSALKRIVSDCHDRMMLRELKRLLLQEFPPFKLARWICEKLEKFLGVA